METKKFIDGLETKISCMIGGSFMKQIIKFIDEDVDGCGMNVNTMIQVEGKQELTNGILQRTKDAIEKYKKENDGEYDTDSIIDVACEYLETEGYMCDYVSEDVTITF